MVDKYYPSEEREEKDSELWEEASVNSDNDLIWQDINDELGRDSRAELDQQNELIDRIERTLGSNPSEKKELPTKDTISPVSEYYQRIWVNRYYATYTHFKKCVNFKCEYVCHVRDNHQFHDYL